MKHCILWAIWRRSLLSVDCLALLLWVCSVFEDVINDAGYLQVQMLCLGFWSGLGLSVYFMDALWFWKNMYPFTETKTITNWNSWSFLFHIHSSFPVHDISWEKSFLLTGSLGGFVSPLWYTFYVWLWFCVLLQISRPASQHWMFFWDIVNEISCAVISFKGSLMYLFASCSH